MATCDYRLELDKLPNFKSYLLMANGKLYDQDFEALTNELSA